MEILTPHSLLMPAFSLERPPRLAFAAASMPARRSPTTPIPVSGYVMEVRSFGGVLEPRYIFRAESLDQ